MCHSTMHSSNANKIPKKGGAVMASLGGERRVIHTKDDANGKDDNLSSELSLMMHNIFDAPWIHTLDWKK